MNRRPQRQEGPSPEAPASEPHAEHALLERLRAGEGEALSALVDELYPSMVRLALSLLGDASQARDVVQETWVAVMAGLSRFEGRASLKTWILRILVNRARTEVSRRGRTELTAGWESEPSEDTPSVEPGRFALWGWWNDPPRAWGDEGPEGTLLRKQMRALVLRELEGLPAGQRTVVELRDVEGLSAEEVCAVLDLSEGNQRVLLHRGRSRLRAALEAELARGGR